MNSSCNGSSENNCLKLSWPGLVEASIQINCFIQWNSFSKIWSAEGACCVDVPGLCSAGASFPRSGLFWPGNDFSLESLQPVLLLESTQILKVTEKRCIDISRRSINSSTIPSSPSQKIIAVKMSVFPVKNMDPAPPTSDEIELVLKYNFEDLNLFAVQNQSIAEAFWEYFTYVFLISSSFYQIVKFAFVHL